ncbi:caspase domain-containing protein [Trametes punicea]|nr:caspase domain-containing protein [Trametes punicea]
MVKIGPLHRTSSHARRPIKRALLIGINYNGTPEVPNFLPLYQAREDATAFGELLIEKYGYARENVVLMLDAESGDPGYTPTRTNILREIRKLVHGARSGDHFTFYYAGHSGQIESPTTEEDDGMDEYIVPVDHWLHPELPMKKRMILDNKLRKLLVDTLPVGANLMAIFDSCHSGTLLDLDHYLCHNIYYPWISPGFRRQQTWWRRVRRKNDQHMTQAGVKVIKKKMSRSSESRRQESSASQSSRKTSTCSVRIYQRKRVSQDEVLVFDTSVGVIDLENGKTRQYSVYSQPSRSVKLRRSTTLSMLLEVCGSDLSLEVVAQGTDAIEELDVPRCDSPTDLRTCNGFCEKTELPDDRPNVISLSACGDSQMTWESKRSSFTQMLIRQLKPNPRQPLGHLVRALTFNLYEHSRKLHQWSKERRQSWKNQHQGNQPDEAEPEQDAPETVLELENFSDPQLGSLRTLTLEEAFDP